MLSGIGRLKLKTWHSVVSDRAAAGIAPCSCKVRQALNQSINQSINQKACIIIHKLCTAPIYTATLIAQ